MIVGRYTRNCAYCGTEFKADDIKQIYCRPTHKYYAYRQRRIERSSKHICGYCGKPWTTGKAISNGKPPKYCAACQEYFAEHYKEKSQ